jgi:hypothetical protein
MATRQRNDDEQDPEILAITQVNSALRGLEPDAQQRVLDYVTRKLNLRAATTALTAGSSTSPARPARDAGTDVESTLPQRETTVAVESGNDEDGDDGDELEGISPVAKKWMKRSSLSADQLSRLFSLGVDEIDLVAKKMPGDTKRAKMRNVVLLKGIAAYLGTGAARVTDEQLREACLHYGAFDNTNFARDLKGMASVVSGSKATGYTLTARGHAEATELVKQMLGMGTKGE